MLTGEWVKSTFSFSNSNCLEARFKRSSRCGTQDCSDCTEAAFDGSSVLVRDSKLGTASPVIEFAPAEWARFLASIKKGPK